MSIGNKAIPRLRPLRIAFFEAQSKFLLLSKNQLGRNATWILIGQGANFFLQAAYFIVLARLLGVTEYGVFAGVFALVNTFLPYSAMGAGMLFMKYVNRDPLIAPDYWGYTLLVTSAVTVFLATVLYLLGPKITGSNDHVLIVSLVFSTCLLGQIVTCASRIFQTFENLKTTAVLSFLSNFIRFVAAATALILFHHFSARHWAFALLIASLVSAIIAVISVQSAIGSTRVSLNLIKSRCLEGLGFSFAGSAQYAYNDVDKTMLSHYGLVAQTGFYSLAYRIVDFATTPIGSIDAALLPRFFKLSHLGRRAVARLAAKSVRIAILIGVGTAAVLLTIVPVVPKLVGRDFSAAVDVVRWLCWLPALRGIHQITGSAITGLGLQPYRTASQVFVALLNIALNVWLIPLHGWKGAAWSSLATDATLSILNAGLLTWLVFRSPKDKSPTRPAEFQDAAL